MQVSRRNAGGAGEIGYKKGTLRLPASLGRGCVLVSGRAVCIGASLEYSALTTIRDPSGKELCSKAVT